MTKPKTYLALILVIFLASACYAQTSIAINKSLPVSGLKESVIVRRDARSVPYIEAKNDSDLFFAQGFETARDRLWQMDLLRHVARGRLAELFGKSVIEEDKRWRRFGFSGIAEEAVNVLNPDLRRALEDYARGVNAYISTLDEKTLPIEFKILQYRPEEWKTTDTIVIGKILADGLSTTWFEDINRVELKNALPKDKFDAITSRVTPADVVLFGSDSQNEKKQKAVKTSKLIQIDDALLQFTAEARQLRQKSLERIGFYAEDLAASNNWVISGRRTADGKAILANDPHLPGNAPGIWYLTHLSTPTMRVSGVTFPGVPGIVLGHNESIAWGATNVGPDVQDVYFEEFNEKGEYKAPDGWRSPRVRKEEIKFRPNPLSPKMESETLEIIETRNGVIFQENKGRKLALKWTARVPKNQEFEAFFSLNRAKNWQDFNNSLRSYGGSAQNFVYADTKGNIGWHVAGKIPIRRKGEGEIPYVGSTNDGDWIDYIPYESLPQIYNPKNGFIVTANQRIVGTDYKYQQLTRQFAAPWRARRIYGLIDANPKITMDIVGDIQHDSFSIMLDGFAKEIVKRKAASADTLVLLKNWNGRMTADSVAATVAEQINECVGREIASENKPASQWDIRQTILPWAIAKDDKLWLPKKFTGWTDLLKQCDVKANEKLAKVKGFGDDKANWKWGSYRPVSFKHPLAAAPLIGGKFKVESTEVDGAGGYSPNVGQSVSMRLIAKPANWDETRHVIPLGQSGDPDSTHWKDQFESWRTGKSAVFPFSVSAVIAAARETIVLMPK